MTAPFELPPYPYDRLTGMRALADRHDGGCVDLSAGTPTDPPPAVVVEALAGSDRAGGYPPSVGTDPFRQAAADWMLRALGAEVPATQVAACVGTKELVAGVPHWLRLRTPERDTVLYPEISYPTYAMGASLAGCRAVGYGDLDTIDPEDAARALCLWVNSPANPSGDLLDLDVAAAWGRARGVPVLSDECYAEFTWDGPASTILTSGTDGVLALHSLSKRSNLAGLRIGFYAGDADLVLFLSEIRKHAGFMVPGPVQDAATAALGDDTHVEEQRARYHRRLVRSAEVLADAGLPVDLPRGAFYLWCPVPDGADGWAAAEWLARRGGVLVAPGDLYGPAGRAHVRVAVVRSDEQLELVAGRLAGHTFDLQEVQAA